MVVPIVVIEIVLKVPILQILESVLHWTAFPRFQVSPSAVSSLLFRLFQIFAIIMLYLNTERRGSTRTNYQGPSLL